MTEEEMASIWVEVRALISELERPPKTTPTVSTMAEFQVEVAPNRFLARVAYACS